MHIYILYSQLCLTLIPKNQSFYFYQTGYIENYNKEKDREQRNAGCHAPVVTSAIKLLLPNPSPCKKRHKYFKSCKTRKLSVRLFLLEIWRALHSWCLNYVAAYTNIILLWDWNMNVCVNTIICVLKKKSMNLRGSGYNLGRVSG